MERQEQKKKQPATKTPHGTVSIEQNIMQTQ